MNGMQWPSGISSAGAVQAVCVQLESCIKPVAPQVQMLQPSGAGKSTPGQQVPVASGAAVVDSSGAVAGQESCVHTASLFWPEAGHEQMLRPSPAG
eukprot:CAMPEP_0197695800 /NCGR_PEP_ID=MMETSP1338-20131121/115681_1 /TAXON_ID=43686 ORGANISM="Pelagodinium beii, Strain RCC1491" /NCGR_SAMPLE_ID=MMETSP1338 /ASSEMBLY_ACC=CAM_ASM_000754 /LENGTH=95 /DNA_ID=CAMNT_0043278833 /DNA_START=302 /DNA_END=589 /DNA_ORIENTATION=-